MSGAKTVFLVLVLSGLLAGCMPTQQQSRMQQDLAEMKRRLARNEKQLAALREGQGRKIGDRFDHLARQQADLQSGIDDVRVQLQSVNGRLDDLGQQQKQLDQKESQLQKTVEDQISSLAERVAKLESRVEKQKTPAPAATSEPAAAEAKKSPHELYEQGLDLIRKKGNFAQGQQVLREFLKRYPQNDLAVNAMYWIGEAYYGEKKYEEAILQFQDVIQKFGHHPKVAAALLKQGLAFHALGDDTNARPILEKVVATFPDSPEAKKAKDFLQEWKATSGQKTSK